MKRLVEFKEDGRTIIRYIDDAPVARSIFPAPYVISDEMPPTEQVDGRFYTSKKAFRSVGKSLGLIEVGTEKLKPLVRATDRKETKQARRAMLKIALEKYKAGHRVRRTP